MTGAAVEPEAVPVLFRAERSGEFRGEVTAVFPTIPGTGAGDVTVYAHNGEHSTGTRAWYRGTREATPAERAALARELESIGYRLHPVRRWTRHHDAERARALAIHRGEES